MVVDASALIAVLAGEPDHAAFERALAGAPGSLLSAATWLEVSLVILHRFGEPGLLDLDRLVQACAMVVVPVTENLSLIHI